MLRTIKTNLCQYSCIQTPKLVTKSFSILKMCFQNLPKLKYRLFVWRVSIYIYFSIYTLLVFCLSVCLCPINVKTTQLDPREVLWMIKFLKIYLHQIGFSINFSTFYKDTKIFHEIRELFLVFGLQCIQRETVHN